VNITNQVRATILAIILGTALASNVLVLGSLSQGQEAENLMGTDSDDWWITYPAQSSAAGSQVDHPQWVLDALESRPVLVYVHKGCSYCRPQTEAIEQVVADCGEKIYYYDIRADGSDSRAEQAVLIYDPTGGVSYVPMRAIVTLAPGPDGKVHVVWHSAEDVTGKAWIDSYVQDAMAYYSENSANWKRSEA